MIMLLLNTKRRWECVCEWLRLLSGTRRYDSVLVDDVDNDVDVDDEDEWWWMNECMERK